MYPDGEQGDDRLETAGKLLVDLLAQPPGGCAMTDLTLHMRSSAFPLPRRMNIHAS